MAMKLEEAIEIKLQWRKDNYPPALPDEMNADMLSIEAMKRVKYYQKLWDAWHLGPLPGETRGEEKEVNDGS
ncbi:unnamed protein product [marine sediment metagenome]|uniref:Uncharacterized protein n=1 Tax=marine sediment metagenome TaxID=412755 RepID=X1KS64_9ZZZZ